jgi:hypothetical protein
MPNNSGVCFLVDTIETWFFSSFNSPLHNGEGITRWLTSNIQRLLRNDVRQRVVLKSVKNFDNSVLKESFRKAFNQSEVRCWLDPEIFNGMSLPDLTLLSRPASFIEGVIKWSKTKSIRVVLVQHSFCRMCRASLPYCFRISTHRCKKKNPSTIYASTDEGLKLLTGDSRFLKSIAFGVEVHPHDID